MGAEQLKPPFALGVIPDSVYGVEEEKIGPGDMLFLYTDGIFDLGEGKEMAFGDASFLELVRSAAAHTGGAFLDNLLASARANRRQVDLRGRCLPRGHRVHAARRGPAHAAAADNIAGIADRRSGATQVQSPMVAVDLPTHSRTPRLSSRSASQSS